MPSVGALATTFQPTPNANFPAEQYGWGGFISIMATLTVDNKTFTISAP